MFSSALNNLDVTDIDMDGIKEVIKAFADDDHGVRITEHADTRRNLQQCSANLFGLEQGLNPVCVDNVNGGGEVSLECFVSAVESALRILLREIVVGNGAALEELPSCLTILGYAPEIADLVGLLFQFLLG